MKIMSTNEKINELSYAITQPVYIGDNEEPDKSYKAIYNVNMGQVASIVSEGYSLIQHKDIANSFIDACGRLNMNTKVNIRQHRHRMIMDIEFPDSKMYVAKGEEFIVGFRLVNSYDKSTGVMIIPRLVRLVCLNGMVVPFGLNTVNFSYRHNQTMVENFSGFIEKALTETINSNDKLKAMVNGCIADSAEWSIVEALMPKLFVAKKHMDAIRENLAGLDKVTRWDLYNAITKYATHSEHLKPNVEMWLQRQADKIMTTKFDLLERQLIAIEVSQ